MHDFIKLWNESDDTTRNQIRSETAAGHLVILAVGIGDTISSIDKIKLSRLGGTETRTDTLAALLRFPDVGEAIFDALREHRDGSLRPVRVACAICYYVALCFAVWAIGMQGKWVLWGLLE